MKRCAMFFSMLVLLNPTGSLAQTATPNILVITADDLGLQLSCYGEKSIRTPQIDQLAHKGVLFRNAYVTQSSCSSSRASLLTGLYPHQSGQIGLSHRGFRMTRSVVTLPQSLHEAGYFTGLIGKLHVHPEDLFPFDFVPSDNSALQTRDIAWVTNQSREFFRQARESDQPFFYYVNYMDPHGPLNAQSDQVKGYPESPIVASDVVHALAVSDADTKETKAATARLLNTILRLDVGVGQLLDELESAGFIDNTLVVFVGDNGVAAHQGKTYCTELGLRVPLIVCGAGVTAKGRECKELVSTIDIAPTLLHAAGVSPTGDRNGRRLQPLLNDEPVSWRRFLFAEMNFHTPMILRMQRSVRDERFKLLMTYTGPAENAMLQLYDLRNDPWETTDLANDADLQKQREQLSTELENWRRSTNDPTLDRDLRERWFAVNAETKARQQAAPQEAGSLSLSPEQVQRLR